MNLYSHILSPSISLLESSCWRQEVSVPFDELIVSWNAFRPQKGYFIFEVRILHQSWSPWIQLCEWGRDALGNLLQRCRNEKEDPHVSLEADTFTLKGVRANAFEIKFTAVEGANLQGLHCLWGATAVHEQIQPPVASSSEISVCLQQFPNYSQMILPHPRARSMCSPTSTYAAMHFLSGKEISMPVLDFAARVYDQQNDIYGNWILNVSGAYESLHDRFYCAVARLEGFHALCEQLRLNIPVVVSIKGPIEGSAIPGAYLEGHLIVVKGWDRDTQVVICMDPAFPAASQTEMRYAYSHFMQAWGRRRYLAYIFVPKIEVMHVASAISG